MSLPSDPHRGGRLLRAESGAILPILRGLPAEAFDEPTVLPGWSVRDVLAHCSAALAMTVTGRFHDFSPMSNEKDVAYRRRWAIPQVLDELAAGFDGAAAAVDSAGGRLDGLALGEWVHGGDVRLALGLPGAYASTGVADALVLLTERSRSSQMPATVVRLNKVPPEPGVVREVLRLGPVEKEPVVKLETDAATLIRICAGRAPDPAKFTLTGAQPDDYLIFT